MKPAASNKFALAATSMLQRNTIEVSRNDNTEKAASVSGLSNLIMDDYTEQKKTIVR